jgi:glycerol-3-phosphate dehydrogenase subunit C
MPDDNLKLDNCVKCSDCNAACPVVKAYAAYPGPKSLGPDMERFRREGVDSDSGWLEYCMGCHRCDLACPDGVNISQLIAAGKARRSKSGTRALRDHWLARPGVVGKLCSSIVPFSNFALNLKPNRWLMSAFVEINASRKLPSYSAQRLHSVPGPEAASPEVVFFPGCFIRYNKPAVGQIVIDLLRQNGFSVQVAPGVCCGAPALANGDAAQFTSCVEDNVTAMWPAVERGARIVAACTSCGYALKADYAHAPVPDSALAASARKLSEATYDVAELLVELLDLDRLNVDFKPVKRKLAYHAPCHLKSQGIGRPWLRLLRAVPGIEIEEINAECCGMAGTYGFKNEKYRISMDIGNELFEGIRQFRPEMVVTECGSCQMQIEHGTHVPTVHPAEILAAAYSGQELQHTM